MANDYFLLRPNKMGTITLGKQVLQGIGLLPEDTLLIYKGEDGEYRIKAHNPFSSQQPTTPKPLS
jgi:hypothetical protein